MHRRLFLLGSAAAAGAGGCSGPAASAPGAGNPSIDAGTGPLLAMVEYQGNTYRYDEAGGEDLGDFIDPGKRFVQRCIRVTHDQLPLSVFFRRDRDSHRAEVVFELGRIWGQTEPANLDSYKTTIMRGEKTIFTADVRQHFWHARWRWQSAPRPVVRTAAELIAAGLLPHYDGSVCPYTRPSRPYAYSPMTLAGLASNGGMTGERGDIGLFTEWQADYICTGNNLSTVLAQGEAMNTFPCCLRDEHTGAPLDALRYPKASTYANSGASPQIALVRGTKIGGVPLQLDPAHEPEGAYLPFLLTGDPYYLETMQFQNVFNLVTLPPAARYEDSGGVRAFAWSLRTAGRLAAVTPPDVPGWLLSRSWCARVLDGYVAWLQTNVLSADTECREFSVVHQTQRLICDFWQSDFITASLCDLVRLGQTSCQSGLNWAIRQTIARTNGTSGWRRSHPTPYNTHIRAGKDAPVPTTWADLWALNYSIQPDNLQPMPDDPTGNSRLTIIKGGDVTYPSYARGVLAMATRLGIAEAKPCFEWLDGEIRRRLNTNIRIDYKWSIT